MQEKKLHPKKNSLKPAFQAVNFHPSTPITRDFFHSLFKVVIQSSPSFLYILDEFSSNTLNAVLYVK